MKAPTLALAVALGTLAGVAPEVRAQDMPAPQTVSARVIDTACYVNFNLSGPDHKMCAEVCANAGVPLGFLGEDGQVYMASGKGMPSVGQNPVLVEHAEQLVKVTGSVFNRGGARSIVVDKIEVVDG